MCWIRHTVSRVHSGVIHILPWLLDVGCKDNNYCNGAARRARSIPPYLSPNSTIVCYIFCNSIVDRLLFIAIEIDYIKNNIFYLLTAKTMAVQIILLIISIPTNKNQTGIRRLIDVFKIMPTYLCNLKLTHRSLGHCLRFWISKAYRDIIHSMLLYTYFPKSVSS